MRLFQRTVSLAIRSWEEKLNPSHCVDHLGLRGDGSATAFLSQSRSPAAGPGPGANAGGAFYCDFEGVHGLPGLAADNHMVAHNCERCRVLFCAFDSFNRSLIAARIAASRNRNALFGADPAR